MASDVVTSLASALCSTFALILLGFVLVKWEVVQQGDVLRGLGKFVGLIALPCLLFRSIAVLDLMGLDWNLVAGVALAKATIFVLVVGVSLILDPHPQKQEEPSPDEDELVEEEEETSDDSYLPLNGEENEPIKESYGEENEGNVNFKGSSTPLLAKSNSGGTRAKWAFAGIRGIFVIQSNDLALGLPLMNALYSDEHESYVHYQYILTTIALVLLNPIGFFMMEYGMEENNGQPEEKVALTGSRRSCKNMLKAKLSNGTLTAFRVIFNVIRNPIILAVLLGIAWNQIFGPNIPTTLDNIFKMLGDAFDACALFTLGASMVNRFGIIAKLSAAYPISLILSKTLLLPILCKLYLALLGVSTSLSLYGFVYGTLPTAPVVFLWAQQFGVQAEVIAATMVLCTIVFAPILFLAANVVALSTSQSARDKGLTETAYTVKYASGASTAGVLMFLIILGSLWYLRRRRSSVNRENREVVNSSDYAAGNPIEARRFSLLEKYISLLSITHLIPAIVVLACSDHIHAERYSAKTSAEVVQFFFMYSCILAGRIGVAALPVIMWMQYHYQQKAIKHAMLVTVSIMVLVPCVASLVLLGIHGYEIRNDGYCASSYTIGADPFSAVLITMTLSVTLIFSMLTRRAKDSVSPVLPISKPYHALRQYEEGLDDSIVNEPGMVQDATSVTIWSPRQARDLALHDRLLLYCMYQLVSMMLAIAVVLWHWIEGRKFPSDGERDAALQLEISFLDKALLFGQGVVFAALLTIMSVFTRGLGKALLTCITATQCYHTLKDLFTTTGMYYSPQPAFDNFVENTNNKMTDDGHRARMRSRKLTSRRALSGETPTSFNTIVEAKGSWRSVSTER